MKISKGKVNLILKKMDFILMFVLISTALFTIAMVLMAWLRGWVPDVLINNWFKYTLGECGICGVLKLGDVFLSAAEFPVKSSKSKKTKKDDEEIVFSTSEIEKT